MDSKDPDIHVPVGECRQQNHTQHVHKDKCDYLNGWIKKQPHTQKSHQKWWTHKKKKKNISFKLYK